MNSKTPPRLTAQGLTDTPHGFFSRAGGVSTGLFTSLNTGPGSSDAVENVSENRARCATAIGADPARLMTLYQIHSATAVIVDAPWSGDPPQADAIVTKTPGLAIGVLTADCMPFLFADIKAGVIAAAHAGWRGALGGVLKATIENMASLGADPSRIKAALGPCLRQQNFEVGLDLVETFTEKYPLAEQFFTPGVGNEKRQFDLVSFGRWRLSELGVTSFHDTDVCTLGDKQRYFSYRASCKADEPDYGRNLSAIMLPE